MGNNVNVIDQQQLDFSRIIELSDLMLIGAEDERWGSVTELQHLREKLLHQFFDKTLVMDTNNISVGIKHMIDTDQKLVNLAEKERGSLHGQINKIKQGRNAVKAYGS